MTNSAPRPITPRDFAARLAKQSDAHKYDHGHALIAAGGQGASGAARLAARAALRVGAGLVTVSAPVEALPECAAQLTAIMLAQADSAEAFKDQLAEPRITAVALGPGHARPHGDARRTQAFVVAALSSGRPVVLDADALTVWRRQAERAHLFKQLQAASAIVTPHRGEFAAVFPDQARELAAQTDPVRGIQAVRQAAANAGAIVLLKGRVTLIAAPDGRSASHNADRQHDAPWLATAGSGDVLTGMITGLAARGWDLFEAACASTWLHAQCARRVGPGLIADDLPEAMPAVMREAIAGEFDA